MYRIGRRFENQVVRRLKKHGIDAKRVPLSGRLNPLLPRCDIIIKINDKELKGQLKYSRTKRVVFEGKEIEQLKNGEINFLCFGFYRKEPKFILLESEEFTSSHIRENTLYKFKEGENLNLSIYDYDADYIVFVDSNFNKLLLKVLDFDTFVNVLKNKQITMFCKKEQQNN
jgi:Holliday junction resolvase